MIKLDLTKFKHIKSDKHSSTLEHKDGHQLVIAHAPLSSDSRKQLEALSNISKQDQTNLQQDEAKHQSGQKMADGGDVQPEQKPIDRTSRVAGGTIKGASGADITDPKTWWADGGKVADKPISNTLNYPELKKEYLDKNKPKYGEHNKPRFAEGDYVSAPTPEDAYNPDSNPLPSQVAPPPQMNPEVQATRDIYNNIVNPVGGKFGGLHKDKAFQGDQAPKDFDANAYAQALEQHKGDLADKQLATQQTTQAAAKDAQMRAAAGIAPAPVLAPPSAMPNMPPSDAQPASQAPQAQSPAQPGNGLDMNNPQGTFQSGVNQQLVGVQAGAKAQGELGQQQAGLLNKNIDTQQQIQQHFSNAYSELESERQNHMQDIKDGYIDPQKYWVGDKDGNGSHSKIATGIGMILAGFNPTNSPNAAINFLKFQMEQNLKAQEKNLDSKNNLLAANLKQFGNLKDAAQMTNLMQHDIVANQLQEAAAKAQNPLAKAAAQQAAGQILQAAAPQAMTFAMQNAMMNIGKDTGANGPQKEAQMDGMINMMRARAPEQAKNFEQLRVPGYDNFAKIPVPQASRDQIVAHNVLDNKGRDLLDFAMKNSGNLDPRVSSVGKVKAAEMSDFLNNSYGLGTMTADKREYLEKQLNADPTAFFNEMRGHNSALREILNSNIMRKGQLEHSLGIHPSTPPAPVPGAEGATIERKDPKSGKIVIYDSATKKPLRYK